MFCPILTSVNRKNLQFNQYAGLTRTYYSDDLLKFVRHKHKNGEIIPKEHGIEVYTRKGSYIYIIFGNKYFCRIDTEKQKKVFFEIS